MRIVLLLSWVTFLLSRTCQAGVVLNFGSPVPGTVADRHGDGTGFTSRLPRTGGALSANDTNLDLSSVPGSLLITSTMTDINHHGVNLGIAEAPTLLVTGLGSNDISVSMLVRGMSVQQGSDQLGIIVGTSATDETVRANLHEGGAYVLSENWAGSGFDDSNTFVANAFNAGDDILLTLSRINGFWGVSWDNLTDSDPGHDGSIAAKPLPWLDASPDLYVGIYAANAGNFVPKTYRVDEFRVDVGNGAVPEASSLIAWSLTIVTVALVYGCRCAAKPRVD